MNDSNEQHWKRGYVHMLFCLCTVCGYEYDKILAAEWVARMIRLHSYPSDLQIEPLLLHWPLKLLTWFYFTTFSIHI